MPSAFYIHKKILRALKNSILPALQSERVTQVLAGPPWYFDDVEHWTISRPYLKPIVPEAGQIIWDWPQEQLTSGRMIFMGFIYEGVADDKVGITTQAAKELKEHTRKNKLPGGITGVRLPAPAVICFPPGVPRRNGKEPYCDTTRPGFAPSQTLWMNIFSHELLVHHSESNSDGIHTSHSLAVNDLILAQLAQAYADELKHNAPESVQRLQGLLLVIMQRLYRHLNTFTPQISNTARPVAYHLDASDNASKSQLLCHHTIEYINLHLQDPLTWQSLAAQMDVSPFHLNYVFRKTTGMSLMRYVNFLRVEAAKEILVRNNERISDIARLTGFSSLASFSACFKRQTGMTPVEFRRYSLKVSR